MGDYEGDRDRHQSCFQQVWAGIASGIIGFNGGWGFTGMAGGGTIAHICYWQKVPRLIAEREASFQLLLFVVRALLNCDMA